MNTLCIIAHNSYEEQGGGGIILFFSTNANTYRHGVINSNSKYYTNDKVPAAQEWQARGRAAPRMCSYVSPRWRRGDA